MNLPTLRTEPLKITAYTYDAKGNLTGQAETPTTDGNGALGAAGVRDVAKPITSNGWTFDAYSLPITITSQSTPNGQNALTTGKLSYIYNASGDPTVVNNLAAVDRVNSTYDAQGRMTLATGNGKAITISYNGKGMISEEVRGLVKTTYLYTAWGAPSLTTEYINITLNKKIVYTCDASHKLLSTVMTGPLLSTANISPNKTIQFGDDKTAKWRAYFSEKADVIVSTALMCSPAFAADAAPNYSACAQYDAMDKTSNCIYEARAAAICRGTSDNLFNNVMAKAANGLLNLCSPSGQSNITANCIRQCLVTAHSKAHGKLPSKGKCKDCVNPREIDEYHVNCFDSCKVSPVCYGNASGYATPFMAGSK